MIFKRAILQMAVAATLTIGTQGLLPAPTCGWCRTPSDFSTYMYQVQHPANTLWEMAWPIVTSILLR